MTTAQLAIVGIALLVAVAAGGQIECWRAWRAGLVVPPDADTALAVVAGLLATTLLTALVGMLA